jgi:hypothetical protein
MSKLEITLEYSGFKMHKSIDSEIGYEASKIIFSIMIDDFLDHYFG